MLYTLNVPIVLCRLYLNKTWGKWKENRYNTDSFRFKVTFKLY